MSQNVQKSAPQSEWYNLLTGFSICPQNYFEIFFIEMGLAFHITDVFFDSHASLQCHKQFNQGNKVL